MLRRLKLGDAVFLGSQTMIQGRYDGTCRIGSHVWIGHPHRPFRCAKSDYREILCRVGGRALKYLAFFTNSSDPVEMSPSSATALAVETVVIGYGADIGTNATILPGVSCRRQRHRRCRRGCNCRRSRISLLLPVCHGEDYPLSTITAVID